MLGKVVNRFITATISAFMLLFKYLVVNCKHHFFDLIVVNETKFNIFRIVLRLGELV